MNLLRKVESTPSPTAAAAAAAKASKAAGPAFTCSGSHHQQSDGGGPKGFLKKDGKLARAIRKYLQGRRNKAAQDAAAAAAVANNDVQMSTLNAKNRKGADSFEEREAGNAGRNSSTEDEADFGHHHHNDDDDEDSIQVLVEEENNAEDERCGVDVKTENGQIPVSPATHASQPVASLIGKRERKTGGQQQRRATAATIVPIRDSNPCHVQPVSSSSSAATGSSGHGVVRVRRKSVAAAPKNRIVSAELLPTLNPIEIQCIQETWPDVQVHLNGILWDTFVSIFTAHPTIKERFKFLNAFDIDSLKKFNQEAEITSDNNCSTAAGLYAKATVVQRKRRGLYPQPHHAVQHPFWKHLVKVARAIAKVVSHINDLDYVKDYLQVLGKIHHQADIQEEDLQMLGHHFVSTCADYEPLEGTPMRVARGESSLLHQQSWLKLFEVIAHMLIRGYPSVEFTLHDTEKAIVLSTFNCVKEQLNGSAAGAKTFLKLFHSYSSSSNKQLFIPSFRESSPIKEELQLDQALNNHALMLIKVVNDVTELFKEEEQTKMESYLQKLGSLHQKQGIKKQYLNVMGPILVQAIRPILQAQGLWSGEVRITWLHFLKVICFHMKAGYAKTSGEVGCSKGSVSKVGCGIEVDPMMSKRPPDQLLRRRRHTTNNDDHHMMIHGLFAASNAAGGQHQFHHGAATNTDTPMGLTGDFYLLSHHPHNHFHHRSPGRRRTSCAVSPSSRMTVQAAAAHSAAGGGLGFESAAAVGFCPCPSSQILIQRMPLTLTNNNNSSNNNGQQRNASNKVEAASRNRRRSEACLTAFAARGHHMSSGNKTCMQTAVASPAAGRQCSSTGSVVSVVADIHDPSPTEQQLLPTASDSAAAAEMTAGQLMHGGDNMYLSPHDAAALALSQPSGGGGRYRRRSIGALEAGLACTNQAVAAAPLPSSCGHATNNDDSSCCGEILSRRASTHELQLASCHPLLMTSSPAPTTQIVTSSSKTKKGYHHHKTTSKKMAGNGVNSSLMKGVKSGSNLARPRSKSEDATTKFKVRF